MSFVRASELLHNRINERFPHHVSVVIPGDRSSPMVQRRKAEITEWVREHAERDYSHFLQNDGTLTYVFESPQDAFMFKIRWA
jgi:hypothetical protein